MLHGQCDLIDLLDREEISAVDTRVMDIRSAVILVSILEKFKSLKENCYQKFS